MTEAIRIAVLNFVHETVTFLEALPYRNVDISKFYPYGDVSLPERTTMLSSADHTRPFSQRSRPC